MCPKITISLIFFAFSSINAQEGCRYELWGPELTDANSVKLTSGASFELDNGQLILNFAQPMAMHKVALQMRSNHHVRMTMFDFEDKLIPHFHNLRAGRTRPMKSEIPMAMSVGRVVFEGFMDDMSPREIGFMQVTACPTDCAPQGQCYGECKIEIKNNCMVCNCPEGSPSTGCTGHVSQRDLHLLWELAKRKIPGCNFIQGYRRTVNRRLNMDECVSFSYPKCNFHKSVIVPRTKQECRQFCY